MQIDKYGGYGLNSNIHANTEYLDNHKDEKEKLKPLRKSSSGKSLNKITLDLRGFKGRLKDVADWNGKRYHTLATDLVISGIFRLEKKHKKELKET